MVDNKRKKFHDKDKYYRLAKEQGLRSRAAFKLSQINRKFPVLERCRSAVLDLCAAPGGWTQIAARTCPSDVRIVAVDLLPIRPLVGRGGGHNVATLVGDITTDKCKSDIRRALKSNGVVGSSVDLVLHDGAPNVGGDYGRDAYAQNEIVLHALRTATQHLARDGAFVTKVYRSRDYASLQWVLQRLFDRVTAFKPAASRQQSAEIFLVCQGYRAPARVDPALTDPRRVFEAVEGETTGGGNLSLANQNMTVFHKNWDKPRRRRGGYDREHLDSTMRHVEPVARFVGAGTKDAIQILSSSTGLAFRCEECRDQPKGGEPPCNCSFLLHHPFTTPEIKECVSDLQLLNKSDFKGLLNWRTKMQDALAMREEDEHESVSDDSKADDEAAAASEEEDSEREESEIQAEIAEMRLRRQRERKRRKKKERAVAAKRRKQAALGMDLNAIDVPEHDKVFSLTSITSKGDLLAASEVNLDQVTDEQLFGGSDDDEDVVVGGAEHSGSDSDDGEDAEARTRRRERDLDEAYNEYLQNTKDGMAKSGTKMAKRSKKLQRQKVVEEAQEDQEMALTGAENVAYDAKTYAKLLQRGQDDSDDDASSSEDEDDGFDADPMTPEEHAAAARQKSSSKSKADNANPLIHKFADEPTPVKTARWFSNPLFANLGKAAQAAAEGVNEKGASSDEEDSDSEESTSEVDEPKGGRNRKETQPLTAEDVLASMPKTDKQIRHEKRLKQMERDERKKARRVKKLGDTEGEFQLVAGNASDSEEDEADQELEHLSEAQRKKVLEARELIKAGLGSAGQQDDGEMANRGIEIVSQEDTETIEGKKRPLPVMDDRKYDSDHEDYDSDDYAQTLALGTMILRRSKEKAFVDASYNRYAWNDPSGLPDWFVDDENKHYRPQLPVPPALVAKMKEKMMALSAKPIAKVAEARARKSKRAKAKLAAAKKQAEAVANSSEMSEAMKLKAISKALQGQEAKKPGKTYVVAKKGRGNKGVKGAKLVDKRMKSDKRATSRIEKKRKKGKQGGLVGSKKRRHHS